VTPELLAVSEAARKLGLELAPEQLARLGDYARLLQDWNRRINLVSRRDIGRVLSYHVVDSLAVSSLIPAAARVCDLGTGAGLPGIPLAVARPDANVLLVESQQKRCQFLTAAVGTLQIANAEVRSGRAEDLPGMDCDVIVSRLTGPVRDAIKYASRHRRPEGIIVLYKTRAASDELTEAARTLARLKLRVLRQPDVVLPLTGITRRFVVVGAA
jgi:16S rRNA (guanine527-N7)-methyltransferase